MKTNRKGFAIVLVAALASLIFLLGASLVVVTRLQTAAASYDQRVRLAREHARVALDMAVADLQESLGLDTAVSYTADALRTNTLSDFKDASGSGVTQPFWVAAHNTGPVSWLVTREMDGSTGLPTNTLPPNKIELLGEGTLGKGNHLLHVTVPTEGISVAGVDGFPVDEIRTIGNYGYWVGDLGTKASYALYDRSSNTNHDGYDSDSGDRKDRLAQMSLRSPNLGIVDTNVENGDEPEGVEDDGINFSNPERIDQFVNDFQFREDFGDTQSDDLQNDRYLVNLEAPGFQDNFHDFTPLSKGLLVNSKLGGFRKDLSRLITTGESLYDDNYLDFAKFARSMASAVGSYNDHRFRVQGGDIPIAPVVTQFNLNYSVYLSGTEATTQNLYVSVAAGIKLWNPFSSALNLGSDELVIEVIGMPDLEVKLEHVNQDSSADDIISLAANSVSPVFTINQIGKETNRLRPGQVAYFRGPVKEESPLTEGAPVLEFSPFQLSFGGDAESDDRALISDGEITPSYAVSSLKLSFVNEGAVVSYDHKLRVSLKSGETVTELATYDLPQNFSLDNKEVTNVTGTGIASFGVAWKVNDDELMPWGSLYPFDTTPMNTELIGINYDCTAAINKASEYLDSETNLLGYNSTDFSEALDVSKDVSVLQLPKQELTSVAQLSGAFGASWLTHRVGDPDPDPETVPRSRHNRLLDEYFYSTVPNSPSAVSDWDVWKPLPNSGYVPVSGATFDSDLRAETSADSLFVHGMFNVHSTSIDSWAALLKSASAADSTYWTSYFSGLTPIGIDVATNPRYLFFNYPAGAEDQFDASLSPSGGTNDEKLRASLSQSMFALTDSSVDSLAIRIVSNIRERIQGTGPYESPTANGPFRSLEDFADSGVLQNAIDDAGGFTPSWVKKGTAKEFRQSTILNLIGSYLSVRSDTFLVRAYGDATNPANGEVWTRAYCEAIVQRVHEEYGGISVLSENTNRKFNIVAFRWLSPSDI